MTELKPKEILIEDPAENASSEKGESFNVDLMIPEYDKKQTARILWKIDWRLVPLLTVLYLASFLNVTNLGNAKIAGMESDLELYGNRYNVALSVFFVPYSLFEIPSNILLKIMKPSQWIAVMMFIWGVIMTLTGIVSSYQGLVAARFFLGLAEAGFFPAAAYLLTLWYKRYEIQSRMAVLYTACSFSGAFGGLLAFAIEKMDGIGGLAGWRWIFIIEGLFPVACSIAVWFFLPDTPETAHFLTEEEKAFIINRLKVETGADNTDKLGWSSIKDTLMDWKIYAMTVIYQGVSVGVYGFTSVLPTVVEDMGYHSATAQLMTVPIYMSAVIFVLIIALWSDHIQTRTPFIIGCYCVAIIGFIAELALPQDRLFGVTYLFLFFIAIGIYGPFVCIMCLCANNLAPSSKRAVGLALLVTIGNFGGFIGSNIFLQSQAPKYPAGFGTCLGILIISTGSTIALRVALQMENKRRDEFMIDKSAENVRAQYTDAEWIELGDKSPLFRYTL
ncbi:hypothetical protein N7540_010713 [Penicillium herquei]|nr:hypothetical protein N7540_010713 [Penicillium herquei]